MEAGVTAILLGLLHTLITFQLLVVLQQGVKSRRKETTDDETSSGRVLTGRLTEAVDSALVASHVSDCNS